MAENQSLLSALKSLLSQKRSKQWYADQLKITIAEVNDLLLELRGKKIRGKQRGNKEEIGGK